MTLIKDLLDLPAEVRKGDFVLALTEGIREAEKTVDNYAVTPSLVQAFERAMSVIGSALRDKRSQAAYLHGSFGSGKSHFMAVLDLMIDGHPAPWKRKKLHPLRTKFPWVGEAKLLRLPLHMIGAASIEQRVFQSYLHWLGEHHPDAPIPALFEDEALFDNARQHLERFGKERFFEALNEGAPKKESAGWGKLAKAATWTFESFEDAATSNDPREREKLFSALSTTMFTSAAKQSAGFIELDRGLEVLSRHAAGLGYDGVVLFLDELILWLAGHMANLEFMQEEAQKLAKLREAQHSQREVPIVSFIARQRNLAELVGTGAYGAQRVTVHDSLSWSEGRFELIVIEDRNLPAIVERRVVKPRDEDAKETLADGFTRMRRTLGKDYEALLGSFADEEDFRRVYPFSPALVETLVALSHCLQRERTAIRILMELLVEHLTDLENGDVVPVGDVFDVMASGEEAFDQFMKDRFERARDLYRNHLLPLIQAGSGTGSRERCQRLRDDHLARLGCSGCGEKACRNDNRLAKTLLLAALVPEAGPFKALTVRKLVALNHGTVKSPIPGKEVALAVGKLRNWATQVGQLRVGDQNDPEIGLRLEGVDLLPIIQSAQQADTPGARKGLLKEILFDALDLPVSSETQVSKVVTWRGTKRSGAVRFGNIRELRDDVLRCPGDAEWYVVVDYPFDQEGYSPEDDIQRLERFKEENGGGVSNPAIAWVPSFFSDKLQRELGQLAIVEFILKGDNPSRHLGHLRPEDQGRARLDLESLKNQKRAQLRRALDQAYGVAGGSDDTAIDPSRTVDDHVVPLEVGASSRPLLAGSFRDGLAQLAERLLESTYPHHPRFQKPVTRGKLEKVKLLVEKLIDAPDQRLGMDRDELDMLQSYASPLGLVQLAETSAHLDASRLREIEQQRERAGAATPTVEQVRAFVDPQGTMGLPREASDLMVSTYTVSSGCEFQRAGAPFTLDWLGKLPDDVELVKPDLPDEAEWAAAIERAGALFGITIPGRARSARNLTSFGKQLAEGLRKVSDAQRLPRKLEGRLSRWAADDPLPPRLETARSGAALIEELTSATAADQVRRLASCEPRTSLHALERSLSTVKEILPKLASEPIWINFESVRGLVGDATCTSRAEAILEDLRDALLADQLNVKLEDKLDELTRRAGELLGSKRRRPSPPSPPKARGWREVVKRTVDVPEGTDVATAMLNLAEELETELGGNGQVGELKVEVTVLRREGDDD